VVAIAAPATLTSLDAVKSVSGKGRVTPHLATDAAIQRAIRRLYYPEDALVSPSAVAMAPISLPESDVDAPFEVESWVAGTTHLPPRATTTPFAPPQRPSGSMPAPFAAPQRPASAAPAPFAPPAPQRPSGGMPTPFAPAASAPAAAPQRPSGSAPSPFPQPLPRSTPFAPAATPQRPSGSMPSPLAAAPTPPPLPSARSSGTFPAVQPQVAAPAPGVRVLVYGWGTEATAALLRSLASEGLPVQVASTAEVLAADARALLVAPLPAMEGLGQRVRAQLIVAGKAPEVDLVRAQALGAKGFLAAPLDADLLLRAVRRLRKAIEADAGSRP
jgi:type IV pilus assembly protein PilB